MPIASSTRKRYVEKLEGFCGSVTARTAAEVVAVDAVGTEISVAEGDAVMEPTMFGSEFSVLEVFAESVVCGVCWGVWVSLSGGELGKTGAGSSFSNADKSVGAG